MDHPWFQKGDKVRRILPPDGPEFVVASCGHDGYVSVARHDDKGNLVTEMVRAQEIEKVAPPLEAKAE